MIRNVKVKENGSIDLDIDNTELLRVRADMSDEPGEQELQNKGLGGDNHKIEQKLEKDKKHLGWSEPSRGSLEVYHICPICGTKFKGRTNRIYCCDRCKKTAEVRRYRKRKRDIRDFKPNRGKAGEVYYMTNVNNRDVISFVPAFNADTRARAKEYLDPLYSKDNVDNIMEQVKEVVKK